MSIKTGVMKVAGIIIGTVVLIYIMGNWFWLIPGGIVLWFLIRWIADIFWWGKDGGKW